METNEYILAQLEATRKREQINLKWEAKIPLSNEEKRFTCKHLRFDYLLSFPFCLNEFYANVYLGFFEKLSPFQLSTYYSLIREWEINVSRRQHEDSLLNQVSKETREELKILKRQSHPMSLYYSEHDHQKSRFEIITWYKYRYIIIKKLFEEEIAGTEYKLSLNHREIIFDEYSAVHIFFRHLGHVMKPYESDKSHFYKDFGHEGIHLKIEYIVKRIDASFLYQNDSMKEITFRFNGTIYRIYCVRITKSSKGLKAKEVMRLKTFFPLEDYDMLTTLNSDFYEKQIDDNLTIYCKLDNIN